MIQAVDPTRETAGETIRDRFEQLVVRAGSPAELAKRSGIDPRSIAMIRSRLKKTPNKPQMLFSTATRISTCMETTVEWLLGGRMAAELSGSDGTGEPDVAARSPSHGEIAPDRWKRYAAGHSAFRRQATLALGAKGGVTEDHLNAAADELDAAGGDEPTDDESSAAIIRAYHAASIYTAEALKVAAKNGGSADAARDGASSQKKKKKR